jgi:hypothetical protein
MPVEQPEVGRAVVNYFRWSVMLKCRVQSTNEDSAGGIIAYIMRGFLHE